MIREGKGRKPRTVFVGQKTRKAIRQYMRLREDDLPALWVTDDQQNRLTYWGLKSMLVRRSKLAGVETPKLHAFRLQFAISCLRSGMNIYYLHMSTIITEYIFIESLSATILIASLLMIEMMFLYGKYIKPVMMVYRAVRALKGIEKLVSGIMKKSNTREREMNSANNV